MRHKQEFCANRVSKFGKAQSWASRFIFHCKTFQGLKYINDKSGAQEPEQEYMQYVFPTYLAKDGFSLASWLQLRGTQGISLNSSTWPGESAPTVVPPKVPVGIPVLLPMISDIQNIISLATKIHNTLEISSHKTKLLHEPNLSFLRSKYLPSSSRPRSDIFHLVLVCCFLYAHYLITEHVAQYCNYFGFFYSFRKGIFPIYFCTFGSQPKYYLKRMDR